MNNSEKARYDAAKRMLKGKIDIEEVAMMMNLTVEELKPIKDEIDEEVRKVYGNVDAYDFDMKQVLFDNFNDTGEDYDIPDEEK